MGIPAIPPLPFPSAAVHLPDLEPGVDALDMDRMPPTDLALTGNNTSHESLLYSTGAEPTSGPRMVQSTAVAGGAVEHKRRGTAALSVKKQTPSSSGRQLGRT